MAEQTHVGARLVATRLRRGAAPGRRPLADHDPRRPCRPRAARRRRRRPPDRRGAGGRVRLWRRDLHRPRVRADARVSALIYAVGYGAGRVRELRDPAAPLTPLALGAVATVFATCGYAVLQFLLGVDVPGQPDARPRHPRRDRPEHADRGPRLRDRAPLARAAPARRPAPPPAPRLHDRRAEPALAPDDAPPRAAAPRHAAADATRRRARRDRVRAVRGSFFRLWYLQVLTGDERRLRAPERRGTETDRGAARGHRRPPTASSS